jgi:hypothetical protein
MVVVNMKKSLEKDDAEVPEKSWENPLNPEGATDKRDLEQLKRQKKEAERGKENLTDNDIHN